MAVLTQSEYQAAVDILTAAIKENFPQLDTTAGTPVKEILINAGSSVYALLQQKITEFGQKGPRLQGIFSLSTALMLLITFLWGPYLQQPEVLTIQSVQIF